MSLTKPRSGSVSIEEIVGDPTKVEADLQQFRKDTGVLSRRSANLIAKYAKRWIAIYDGEVRADAISLGQLLTKIDAQKLPREKTVVRYIARSKRRMIL